jgi:hypothetical protein
MDHVTHLGLDVHKDTTAVAILRLGQNVPDERTIPNTPRGAPRAGGSPTGSHVKGRVHAQGRPPAQPCWP